MTKVNNQTTTKEGDIKAGVGGSDPSGREMVHHKITKLPFPETFTNAQGSLNKDMPLRAPETSKNRDFATEEFTAENKNPNNESYAKTKQPKGANPKGTGVIGKLANSSKWGQTGNS